MEKTKPRFKNISKDIYDGSVIKCYRKDLSARVIKAMNQTERTRNDSILSHASNSTLSNFDQYGKNLPTMQNLIPVPLQPPAMNLPNPCNLPPVKPVVLPQVQPAVNLPAHLPKPKIYRQVTDVVRPAPVIQDVTMEFFFTKIKKSLSIENLFIKK